MVKAALETERFLVFGLRMNLLSALSKLVSTWSPMDWTLSKRCAPVLFTLRRTLVRWILLIGRLS